MTSPSSQQFESYVPVYDSVPEKWEDAREFLVEHLKKISNAVNVREIGFFLDEELLSGKQFIPSTAMSGTNSSNSQQFRTILRKVIDTGALPNTGTTATLHGINFDSNFTLIALFGGATDPTNRVAISLGHAAPTPANCVELYINATQVIITTGSNRSSYTRSFVTIEYCQEL